MHTVYDERKKLVISVYKVVFSITIYLLLVLYGNTLYAQQYYWEKATSFPGAGSEAVTDLEAADGIIRYNNNKYAYENEFVFKRIETLVNNDGTTPGNFFWTGPQGKWIFEEDRSSNFSPVYTFDPATKQLRGMCNLSQYGYYGGIDKNNIVFFKNRYYTLGSTIGMYGDIRIFRRYNAATCEWDEIPLPSNPKIEGMDKMITDGTTLYIIATDNTLGDAIFYGSQDAVNWNVVQSPAPILNNPWYCPKQQLTADKRGFILLKKMEEDQVTGATATRFFIMKDQQFTQVAMSGDQPIYGYWGDFKLFDSGNLFSLSLDKKELLKSTDKGNSWTKIATANVPEDINDYIETKDGNIYIGTASGVYVLKKFKDSAVTGCADLTYKKKIINEVRCKKGSATFYVNGGVAPYTISFQNKLYHTADSLVLPGLQNGYYEIHIQDRNNCYVDTDFYVNMDIKKEMEVTFSDKDTCSGYYNIIMKYGYPPYVIRWKEGAEQKQQIVEDMSAIYYLTYSVFYLTKDINYQFAVSDQSGCTAILSPIMTGGIFNPAFTYTATDNCDSVLVTITVPDARATDKFTLKIKNDLYQVIKTEQWTGAVYTGKVAHNAYYLFEVFSNQTYCSNSLGKRFTKPKLAALTTRDIYCNGATDIKGGVNLELLNINSEQQIIWSDIGEYNVSYRSDLNAGVYSFEIPEETGCGVKRTFEIKKDVSVTTIPEIPFLCPEEVFFLVPTTTENNNSVGFEVWGPNNQYWYLNKGQGIYIMNEVAASYTIAALNTTNNCSGPPVKVVVETPDSSPVLPANAYTFCTIGDPVILRAASPNAYWYAASDNKLLGAGVSLSYTTTRPKDSVYVQLQNEDGTCTSLSAFVKLTLSDLIQPEIKAVSATSNKIVLKPVRATSPGGNAITYSWYGDTGFIGVGDSLIVESGQWNFIQLEAKDATGCIAEKSEKYYPQFSLGIKDFNAEKLLTVFPNPTRDRLVVQINKGFDVGLLKIKDMSGKSIWQSNIGQQTTEVSLSECASGTYIVEVQLDNQELLHMLVVKY